MTTPRQTVEGKRGPIDYSRLRTLLDEQESLFLRLEALSKQQSRFVQDEQTDDLLRVLGERQGVIESLGHVAQELEPYRTQWDVVLAGARPEQRERFGRQVEQLAALAASIAARDEADRQTIEDRRDKLAGDLAAMGRMRGAVAAYGSAKSQKGPKFQDMEG